MAGYSKIRGAFRRQQKAAMGVALRQHRKRYTRRPFDPYWDNVVLLLEFDDAAGTGWGGTTDNFQDSSGFNSQNVSPQTANRTAVVNSPAKFGRAAQIITAGNFAVAATGSPNTRFSLGAGQFTFEGWFYWTDASATSQHLLGAWGLASSRSYAILRTATGHLQFVHTTDGSTQVTDIDVVWAPSANTWYHIAADRDTSNLVRLYVDGVVQGSATVSATFATLGSPGFWIMGNTGGASPPAGTCADEVRVTKGIARYAGAFSPPTAPFPGPAVTPTVKVTQNYLTAWVQNPAAVAVTQTYLSVWRTTVLAPSQLADFANFKRKVRLLRKKPPRRRAKKFAFIPSAAPPATIFPFVKARVAQSLAFRDGWFPKRSIKPDGSAPTATQTIVPFVKRRVAASQVFWRDWFPKRRLSGQPSIATITVAQLPFKKPNRPTAREPWFPTRRRTRPGVGQPPVVGPTALLVSELSRETLYTTDAVANIGGLTREALYDTDTAATIGGLTRETLHNTDPSLEIGLLAREALFRENATLRVSMLVREVLRSTTSRIVHPDPISDEDEIDFLDERFPEDVSWGSLGGPCFMTNVAVMDRGQETRNQIWSQPRAKYQADWGIKNSEQAASILGFFRKAKGRKRAFRYKDWMDFSSVTAQVSEPDVTPFDQPLGTGDGTTKQFQITKTYDVGSGFVRTIFKPVAGTVRVGVNGVEVSSGWAVTSMGKVIFTAAPAVAAVITVGYEFDVPCRFDNDDLDLTIDDFEMISGTIPLSEVRLRKASTSPVTLIQTGYP